jgi:hypothetical protein
MESVKNTTRTVIRASWACLASGMSGNNDLHAQEMAGLVGGVGASGDDGTAQGAQGPEESQRLLAQSRITVSGGSGGSVEQLGLLQQHEVRAASAMQIPCSGPRAHTHLQTGVHHLVGKHTHAPTHPQTRTRTRTPQ